MLISPQPPEPLAAAPVPPEPERFPVSTMLAVNEATGFPEQPETPELRRLLQYWNVQRGTRAFPRRCDLDPLDFWYMLDRVALTEVHEDPRRYRLRLVGGYWQRLSGVEMTGMWLDEWPHGNQRKITEDFYATLIDGRVPRFQRRDAVVDYQTLRYEIMLLPISEDGARISMIMTGIGQS